MARLFISYKREEEAYAFAIRQWLMDHQGWRADDIFVDLDHLRAGADWAPKLLREAEAAEAMLYIASEAALAENSFCYQELRVARGTVLAVTIKDLSPQDERLRRALPHGARARQITALDQQPTEAFTFVSPRDGTNGHIGLNRAQVESIGDTLRDLGLAPNSFAWTPKPEGPYPGLVPLEEGEEAIFCARDIEIRDGLRRLEELAASPQQRALIIQAPSGAGKSSFLRAGLWRRLRRHQAFTPLAIVRTPGGAIRSQAWGLVAGIADTLVKVPEIGQALNLAPAAVAERFAAGPVALLAAIADADRGEAGRRTLLVAIDQAEEMTTLDDADSVELDNLVRFMVALPADLPARLVLTARDDSLDQVRERLMRAGLDEKHAIADWRLPRLPATRFAEVVTGPALAARRAGWPLAIEPKLVEGLANAAAATGGGDALPILALTLQRLVKSWRAPDGGVSLSPERAEGFLASAVAEAAAEARRSAGASEDDLRRLVIPQLATWDPTAGGEGAAKRQVATEVSLFSGPRADPRFKALADALVAQRLLTRSHGEPGVQYEVAHEALLRVAPLGQLIYERRDRFELARILEVEAREWDAAGRVPERLGRNGERLREARALLEDPDFGADLARAGSLATPYLTTCAAHERAQIDKQRRIIGRAFVKPALAALEEGSSEHALRLAVAGAELADDLGLELVLELWSPAARAAFDNRTRAVMKGHTGAIYVSVFSPDGRRILTASSDNTARVWDAESGTEIALLKAHGGGVRSASFSPDGTSVLTASSDRTARIWDAESGTEIALLEAHVQSVNSALFSPDGRRIVTASDDNTARVWDAESGKVIALLKAHERSVNSASFSPDGRRIVTASSDKTARVWDAESGQQIALLKAHRDWVRSASFSPNGTRVVTASSDRTARIWDAESGQEIALLRAHAGVVAAASFSPDGTRVVTASSDQTARLWDAETGKEIAVLKAHTSLVRSASFSPDGTRVVTASSDHTVRIWDAGSGTEFALLKAHGGGVRSASFSPDGTRVVTASSDQTARVWAAETGNEIAVLKAHGGGVRSASFSPDGTRVVTASSDQTARIWDAGSGTEIALLKAHVQSVNSASFSPDGRRIVTASDDNTARVWDAESGTEIAVLKAHSYAVRSASFSPDGTRVVTASDDQTARIWDAESGKQIALLKAHAGTRRAASFSPDGRKVVTGSDDRTACIWDAESGREIALLKAHNGSVRAASFCPDGRKVVTASDDRTARIWDAESGQEIALLKAHAGVVAAASFGPDGKRVVTTSYDTTARVWDADTGQEIALLHGHRGGVVGVSWHPSGRQIVTAGADGTARIWDVSRTEAIMRDRAVVLTAALANGIGYRTDAEAADLLMQDAKADLYTAALARLGDRASQVPEVAASLRAPLHPYCYLSPTQFAEKFGVTSAARAAAAPAPAGSPTQAQVSTDLSAPAPLTPRPNRPPIGPYDQRPEIQRHVEKLGPDTPLAALLAEPALDDRLKVYEDANAEAERAQNGYKHWGRIALVLMTVATLVSALMLFPLERLWPEANRWQGIVSALQSAANIIALFVVWSLNRRGAVGRWMETRAEAERLRGGFFRAMLTAPTPAGVDAGRLWREKLALFDAAHLDYQSAYYRSAIRRHSRNSSARAWPRALAASAIGISITLGLGALLYNFGFGMPGGLPELVKWLRSFDLGEPIRWQLGLNTAASALLAYASARAIISQDERNAALYRMTLNRLDALRNEERREAVAASASAGDGDAVLRYAEEAQEILDADHLAWRLSRPPEVVGEAPPAVLKV